MTFREPQLSNTHQTQPAHWLRGDALQTHLAFWKEQLGAHPPVSELPADFPRLAVQTYRGAEHTLALSSSLGEALRKKYGDDLQTAALAAFQVMLYRYTGQEDLALAFSSAGNEGSNGQAGTALLLRTNLRGNPSCAEVFARTRATLRAALAHRALPFEQLVAELFRDRDLRQYPLFQTMFTSAPIAAENHTDLVLHFTPTAQGYVARFRYNADLFKPDTMARMAGHYETLLRGFAEHAEARIAALPMLTEAERQRMLREWNATQTAFPQDKCLHQLFEDHVARAPEAVALRFGEVQLSYRELNRRANQLAHYLRGLGVDREVRVGISLERSVEMALAILGVLKAGGAYVPIDPAYPKDRQAFMLHDSQVKLLLTQKHLVEKIPAHEARLICVDGDWHEIAKARATNPHTEVTPQNLAYVIYTSGSTGRPKGIALRHQGVVNNIFDLNDSFGVGAGDQCLAISSLSFDMCVYEVLGTLAAGGAIIMPAPERLHDVTHWAELVARHGVTVWNSAPQLLEMLVSHTEPQPALHPRSIRVVILGGDWVPVTLPDRLQALAKNARVIVLGGATEASIHSIVFPVLKTDPQWKSIPYGKPQRNQRAYILDANLQPLPLGLPGELHLGGLGLARGYYNRPELTVERFLPNEFSGESGDRIYKTGDLARWKEDGNIELIGRMDHQVKIRGHRIELGEIAAVLKEHEAVAETVVIAREDEPGDKRLVAYVVPGQVAAPSGNGEQISQWRSIYDDTYAQESDLKFAPTMNFVGWISSFTGLPFSEEELRESLDRAVARILALRPERVLEIGCGTGLILFRVAPHCQKYDASDLSPVALQGIAQQLQQAQLTHVALQTRLAHDFEGVPAEAYDTVIINSVTQHFPSIAYLKQVLAGAVRALKPGGAIFIGDIRSLPHLEWFQLAIEMSRAVPGLSCAELRQRVQRRVRQEKELFIDPAFFSALHAELPQIAQVRARLKRGRHHNEINKFHYDVILRVGESAAAPEITWLDWQKENLSLSSLRARLVAARPARLGLRRVPNARVCDEARAWKWLREGETPADLGALRAALQNDAAQNFIDPEALCQLSEELGYVAEMSWSGAHEPGRCDVLLQRRELSEEVPPRFAIEQEKPKPWPQYGNQPFVAGNERKLMPELRSYLSARLPDYMVPAAFVFMEKLPLSPNGKLDRRALPAPEHDRPELAVDFVGAQNPLEEILCAIWAEALGLHRVGVHDNFFELGGHSLTATQIISRTSAALQITVPLRALFENPTVAQLAQSIQTLAAQLHVNVVAVAETLAQINQLSEEEAEAMLEERLSLGH